MLGLDMGAYGWENEWARKHEKRQPSLFTMVGFYIGLSGLERGVGVWSVMYPTFQGKEHLAVRYKAKLDNELWLWKTIFISYPHLVGWGKSQVKVNSEMRENQLTCLISLQSPWKCLEVSFTISTEISHRPFLQLLYTSTFSLRQVF